MPAEASTFTCAQCGGTFPKGWSDAEALAEGRDIFGDQLGPDPAVVCDDCWKAMDAALPMREWATDRGG